MNYIADEFLEAKLTSMSVFVVWNYNIPSLIKIFMQGITDQHTQTRMRTRCNWIFI